MIAVAVETLHGIQVRRVEVNDLRAQGATIVHAMTGERFQVVFKMPKGRKAQLKVIGADGRKYDLLADWDQVVYVEVAS